MRWKRWWDRVTGRRRQQLHLAVRRRRMRLLDEGVRKLERLRDQATGIERLRCINDIHMIKSMRIMKGL